MTTQQYDLIPGIDPSGLSSITQAQLLAFGAQAAPFDNIGFIIVGSGASSAHPNVTDNPRFVRYIWLDTQTAGSTLIKVYQGTYPSDTYADWVTIQIADSSITAAKLADYAVSILNLSNAPKIAYQQTAAADATKANYMVRLDAAGQFVEVAPLAPMVAALTLNPAKIDISSASDGWVLTYDSSLGVAVWKALAISSLIAANSLSYDKLANASASTNGYILRSDPITGVWAAILPNDTLNTIFTLRSIRLAALADTGASNLDTIRFDGTNWVRRTPFYGTMGITLPTADGTTTVAHGLGSTPRRYGAYAICNSNDAATGYIVGDVIQADSVLCGAAFQRMFSIWANNTLVGLSYDFATTVRLIPKAGGAAVAVTATTNFDIYAWAEL